MFLLAFADIQLIPDGTLIIHIALVLIMIWVLNRTLFRPINQILDKREQNSGGAGSGTDSILKDAAAKAARYDAEMLAARSEGYEKIEARRAAAVAERRQMVEQAKQEADGFIAEQKRSIEEQAAAAREEVAREADKMAEKIAANILKA